MVDVKQITVGGTRIVTVYRDGYALGVASQDAATRGEVVVSILTMDGDLWRTTAPSMPIAVELIELHSELGK